MNKDLKYIKEFKEITINKICQELHIAPQNLYTGKMNSKQVHRIRVELEKRLGKLNEREKRIIKSRKKRFRKKRSK